MHYIALSNPPGKSAGKSVSEFMGDLGEKFG